MRIHKLISLVALAAMAIACTEKIENGGNEGGNESGGAVAKPGEIINGTTINEGSTVCGLIADADGQPFEGVPVTDGYTYVKTDKNGVYQMAANRFCRNIYISLPADCKLPLDATTHLPKIYSDRALDKGKISRIDFKLERQDVEEEFTLIMIGDPQCQTAAQVARYKNETIPDMQAFLNTSHAQNKYLNPYAVTLGDITFDSTELWGDMKGTMSNISTSDGKYIPYFQCIGNHDHNSLEQSNDYNAAGKFVETFGPTDYSFNRGKTHVVVMDDIMVTQVENNSSPNRFTWNYNGGFTSSQYRWLQADLAQVSDKTDKMVILCLHIPFRGGSDSGGSQVNKTAYYKEVLALLTQFKEAHIMIGHTHYPQNYIHTSYKCKGGQPIYEHIHGAACGSWWSCNSNVTGAPNGYSLYEVKSNTITNWAAKGTDRDLKYQIRAYDGNQIYNGTKGYEYSWYNTSNKGGTANITAAGNVNCKNAFVAEIWNDDNAYWKVEMFQNGAKIGDFTRIPDNSCANICITSYYFNELGKNTSTWTNKTASHYWYFVPKSFKPSSETNWEIKATQTIPSSGETNVYYCTRLTTDYTEF